MSQRGNTGILYFMDNLIQHGMYSPEYISEILKAFFWVGGYDGHGMSHRNWRAPNLLNLNKIFENNPMNFIDSMINFSYFDSKIRRMMLDDDGEINDFQEVETPDGLRIYRCYNDLPDINLATISEIHRKKELHDYIVNNGSKRLQSNLLMLLVNLSKDISSIIKKGPDTYTRKTLRI